MIVDGPSIACGIFSTETVQAGLALGDIYYWFASGFGDLANLAKPHFSVWDGPLLGSVTCTTVQFFFAYRIWILSEKKSWPLCLMICFVSHSCSKSSPDTVAQRCRFDSYLLSLDCQSAPVVSM